MAVSKLPTGSTVDEPDSPNGFTWGRLALALLLVTLFMGFFAIDTDGRNRLDWLKDQLTMIRQWRDEHYTATAFVFGLGTTLLIAASFPFAWMLTLMAGALFDLVLGTVVMSFASTTGATLAFLMSRYVLRDAVRARFERWLGIIDQGMQHDGAFYLFLLRLTPAVPFFVINVGMGLTALRTRTFWWVSQVGMLPGTLLYVNAGREVARLSSPSDVLSPSLIVSFVALAVVPLLLKRLLIRRTEPEQSTVHR